MFVLLEVWQRVQFMRARIVPEALRYPVSILVWDLVMLMNNGKN